MTRAEAPPGPRQSGWMRFRRSFRRVAVGRRVAALTFDDGPNPPHTQKLLEVLGQRGVRATFFMRGDRIARHPETAAAVVEAGHEVGNHGYSHRRMVFRSAAFVRREIERTDEELRKIGVRGAIPFRSPYGSALLILPLVLRAKRRWNVLFDVSPRDWADQAVEVIVERTLRKIRPGSIVLLHDGGGDRAGTVRAVDRLIPELRALGYELTTVSQLLAAAQQGHHSAP